MYEKDVYIWAESLPDCWPLVTLERVANLYVYMGDVGCVAAAAAYMLL
jgi:hypothetical protein